MRIRLRGTREKFTHYSVTGVTEQNTWVGVGGGCFPDYSRVPRARSTHDSFLFYPPPTPTHVHKRVPNPSVLVTLHQT